MQRRTLLTLSLCLFLSRVAFAQEGTPSDREAMIQSAASAALHAISANATIMDWENNVLREGTNGWTCFPDMHDTAANDPMCFDKPWLRWAGAWMNKTEPHITRIGISYMLQGGSSVSNSDPYATGPTPTNQWIEEDVPHLMIVLPDSVTLEGLPTDPYNGGPWVMYKGTPYVHIMVPVPHYEPAATE